MNKSYPLTFGNLTVLMRTAHPVELVVSNTDWRVTAKPAVFRAAADGARKTPATPCITLYYALAKQLEDISSAVVERDADKALRGADAWNARFARHRRMQERTLDWAAGHGFDSFPRRENGSPTVSCLRAGSLDVAAFAKGLDARGLQISNGYGPLKGETFRIGHMGDHTEAGLEDLLTNADEVLRSLR